VGNVGETFLHGKSCGNSFFSMCTVTAPSAENGHDAVADILIDIATTAFDLAGEKLKNIIDKFKDFFGI
jgi:hypothetical protein